MDVYPYTKDKALLAGRLDGEQQSLGVTIPFVDLLIGGYRAGSGLLSADRQCSPLRMISFAAGVALAAVETHQGTRNGSGQKTASGDFFKHPYFVSAKLALSGQECMG